MTMALGEAYFFGGGLYGNLAAAAITLVYVKLVIVICDYGVSQGILAPDVSRKLVHLAAASLMIWWPLFDDSDASWKLNIFVPAVFSIQLFVKGAILQNPNDPDVRIMSRTGKPVELLYGPLIFTIAMNINGLFLFNKPESVYCMAALGFGDGVAPLIGKRYPIFKYKCPGGIKSIGGSMAVFVASIVGFFLLQSILGFPETTEWAKIFAMALTATIAEALAPVDFDNVTIPLAVYFVVKQMGVSP
jgi:phytol kinase